MGRLVSAGSLVYDQPDFYFPAGSSSRAQGVSVASLSLTVFVNNAVLSWPLVDGSSVLDSSIVAGTVYFNQIQAASPGFYSLRFFPDRTGFWRLVLSSQSLGAEVVREFDVAPAGSLSGQASSGLNASFIRP